jgi:capsular polysaccharide export protein
MNIAWQPQGQPALAAPSPARAFLFLQGLPGPFFRRLGAALVAAGAGVRRVNFNGGDVADWPGGIAYRGRARDWPAALAALIEDLGITDIVLFGDNRPQHIAARRIGAARAIRVHVFEEGYLRPDFVTLEAGGVNGHSPLRRDLASIRAAAALLPPVPDFEPIPGNFPRRAREGARYYAASIALRPLFPHAAGHRPVGPLREGLGWLRRFARRRGEAARTAAGLACLAARDYFVLPLQLDSDSQLHVHSRFDGMAAAIAEVVASFARAAPASALLLVKQHPLDPALGDWRRVTAAAAAAAGVSDRVIFIEGGEIGAIVAAARGVVTVNSTTGTLALAAGVPVKVLGTAVYDIAGLTASVALDAFWVSPGSVDAGAYAALRRLLVHRSLVHGGFHSDAGLALLVAGARDRLLGAGR